MTLEELKEEANKLGYNIIPKSTYIRRKRCRCGSRSSLCCHAGKGYSIHCSNNCGFETEVFPTEKEARIAWNELMEDIEHETD